jgi:hypothetical protein
MVMGMGMGNKDTADELQGDYKGSHLSIVII